MHMATKINFQKQEVSLFEWQKDAEDHFVGAPAPEKWFKYMEYLLILGTLNFFAKLTESRVLKVLSFISLMAVWNAIGKSLFTFPFQKYLPFNIDEKKTKIIVYIIVLIVNSFTYLIIEQAVSEIVKVQVITK